MKRILIAPVLAISLSAWANATTPGDLFARMEVRSGRAQVIQLSQAAQSVRQGESLSLDGKAHLEVPAGSEVRVSYPGLASLQVWGPASFDWQPSQPNQTGNTDITWNFFKVTWCDLEVRKGVHHLNLPGDWRAQVDGGSLRLRGLATGPLEMRLNAGRPVKVSWIGEANQARPPLTILPGSNIRLEQPTHVPVDKSNQGSKWTDPAWPYRRVSDTDAQQKARSQRPEQLKAAPSWPLPPVPVQETVPSQQATGMTPKASNHGETQAQVTLKPHIQRVSVQPLVRSEIQPFSRTSVPVTQPVNQGTSAVQNSPESHVPSKVETKPVAKADFQNKHWRGVNKSNLSDCNSIVFEKKSGVEVRVFAGARTKVLVDRWDGKSTWVFTPKMDYHLSPGAVAAFDAKGGLTQSHGTVESFPVIQGRPAFQAVK